CARFFILYYIIFRVLITALNIKTPGRDASILGESEDVTGDTQEEVAGHPVSNTDGEDKYTQKADKILIALGGRENIDTVDYCTTRLRVDVHDDTKIDEGKLKASRAHGVVKPGKNNVQVVVGTEVEHVAEEMKRML